jgi:hypothetical protein
MKRYRIHAIYPIVIGAVLFFGGIGSIQEILDPSYNAFLYPHFPRALPWYLVGFGWFLFFTVNYQVEVHQDGYYKLNSLCKTTIINFGDIYQVTHKFGLVTIFHKGGKTSVSDLIDGVTNIISVFQERPFCRTETTSQCVRSWSVIFKVLLAFALLFYAIYVEFVQMSHK